MFAYCSDMPGVTSEIALRVESEVGSEPVPGLLAHVAGPYDGGWRIIDIWESEEHCEMFRAERLDPAVGRATRGLSAPPMPFDYRPVTGDDAHSRLGSALTPSV